MVAFSRRTYAKFGDFYTVYVFESTRQAAGIRNLRWILSQWRHESLHRVWRGLVLPFRASQKMTRLRAEMKRNKELKNKRRNSGGELRSKPLEIHDLSVSEEAGPSSRGPQREEAAALEASQALVSAALVKAWHPRCPPQPRRT